MIGTGTSSGEKYFKAPGANWIYELAVLGTLADQVSSSCGGPRRDERSARARAHARARHRVACTRTRVIPLLFLSPSPSLFAGRSGHVSPDKSAGQMNR